VAPLADPLRLIHGVCDKVTSGLVAVRAAGDAIWEVT
jgi:hypothetical protein